jgi:hypothetical protein
MSGDFLSRWSRRKLEVQRTEEEERARPEVPALPVDQEPAADELSPEELAGLPPVESLTAESDIAAFLRKGVPQALRNAALRRAWALDPEIRDYVGHARDYGYDWNVPGGVPGTGPLDAGTDVARMVEDVFGRSHDVEAEERPEQTQAAQAEGPRALAAQTVAETEPGPPERSAEGEGGAESPPRQSSSTGGHVSSEKRKPRHGGAKPA